MVLACGEVTCENVLAFCRLGSRLGVTCPTCCTVAPPLPLPLPPPPLLLLSPAACVLPAAPRPLSTAETCALPLGTPRIGPPASARFSAESASNGP